MRTALFPGLPSSDNSDPNNPVGPLVLALRDAQPADVIRSLVSSDGDTITESSIEDMTNWETLDDSEIERIYKRLPSIDDEEDENTRSREMEFVKRDSSLAVPRSQGETVRHTFPPQTYGDDGGDQSSEVALRLARDQKEMESNVLRVVRHMPEGEVPMAPHLTVTFSQPMAAVSTLDQLPDASDWIEIEPRVPGRYRWLGTQTIMFEPEHRFHMSTEYFVRVRADRVQSASSGARLQRDFEFKFITPTARVRSLGPNGVTMTNEEPVFHVQFDQKIDAEKVLQTISLTEAHQPLNSYPLKLLSTEGAKQIVESQGKRSDHLKHFYTSNWEEKDINQGTLQQGFWFTTQQKNLPLDKHYTITVGPHVPSQEGPRTSDKKHTFSFSTFAPLRVSHHYPSDKAVPMGSWTITFNNAIDQDRFEQFGFEHLVKISPVLDKVKYNLSGSNLSITGRSKGDTTYTVELSSEIEDVFGQRLREGESITFQVGRAAQTFHAFMQGLITLDPTEPNYSSSYSVVVCNVDKLTVQINQVQPEQFGKALAQFWLFRTRNKNDNFNVGRKVFHGDIETGAAPDEPKEVVIDISKYLQHANEKLGHILIHVEPSKSSWETKNIDSPRARAWIQSTRIAVETFVDQNRAICFTNSLADGRPYDGVSIKAIPIDENNKKKTIRSAVAVSDSTGMTQIPDLEQSTRYRIVATHLNDSCIVQNCYPRQVYLAPMTWYVANDRGLYKPKEKVYMKGIIRFLKSTEAGAFYRHEMPMTGSKINFRMTDARGVEFAKGSTETNQYGAFMMEQQLPDNINLGNCSVFFEMEGRTDSSHYTNFQVQEFRTPEFKVQCELLDSEKAHLIADDSAVISVKASYYAGGPLPGTNTEYLVTQESSRYTPPGWSVGRWIFQKEEFGWFFRRGSNIYPPHGQRPVSLTHSGITDASGEHQLCIEYKTNKEHHPRGPATVIVNASVQDINRQTLSTSTSLLVHPSSLYVGIKPRRRFGKAGTPFVFDVIVTDIGGKVIPNVPFTTSLIHHSNEQKGNQVVEKDITILERSLESENVEKEVQFDLPPEEGGSYTVSVSIKDTHGRINETSMTFSVQGITSPFGSNTSSVQEQQLTIIADKDEYEPGDEAQLLVQVPFSEPCELVVLTATGRIVNQSRHTLKTENCTLIRIPIKQEYLPRVTIKMYAVSADKRVDESGRVVADEQAPLKPAFGSGSIELKVSMRERRLNVDIKPARQQLSPGNSTDVDINITDHHGIGIPNAEVTLIAVDEAILSLTNYSLADPLPSFYPAHFSYIDTLSNRSTVMVRNWSAVAITAPQEPFETLMFAGGGARRMGFGSSMTAMPMMKMAMSMEQSSAMDTFAFRNSSQIVAEAAPSISATEPIQARTNFNPVAAFVGSIVTDGNGVARAKIQLPDNLTRYRVWAIGHTLDRFGLGESHLIASLPLMVRCSLPRFANFGDRIEATVLIQNQTSDEATVNVVSRYLNLKHADGSARGFKLRIPASDRKEVRFSITTALPGEAKFQCGAELVGTNFADAAVVNIPVYTPTTTEAFATYGEIDGDGECIVQPITRPQNVYSNFGGLKINTSSTILQSLTDAFLYLWEYPFLCVEQISSRILSIVALQDVLEAFNVKGLPSREKIMNSVNQGLQQLRLSQKDNGSFGFWDRNSEVHPYVTVHAAFALIQTKMQGHEVDDQMINSVANWLRNIEQHLKSGNLVSIYDNAFILTIRAYALYVLSLIDRHAHGNMGDRTIVTQAKQLFAEFMTDERTRSKALVPDLECISWLAQAIFNCNAQDSGDEVIQHALHVFRANCQETAETANFVTDYSDDDSQRVLLRSSRRTDGIVLDTLLCIDTQKQQRNLVTKVVKGLLAQRKRVGRWRNTQENVFILLALKNFFQKYESAVPDYVARVWIAEQFAGEQEFKGRSVDTQMINVPMSFLMDSERSVTSDLVIQKAGKPGRLYYRIGMDYAPLDLRQSAAQYGFTIVRTYEHISDPSHVSLDADQQCWKFKLGELVRVRIKISNVSRRYHVAMVDWMPAGLEALNPELATTGPIPGDDNSPPSLLRIWWNRPWFEHTNMRDERVEAFASLLWEGDHEFTYVARATSAGEFVVPPCKIEEMYSPEIFGRSASEMVVIG